MGMKRRERSMPLRGQCQTINITATYGKNHLTDSQINCQSWDITSEFHQELLTCTYMELLFSLAYTKSIYVVLQ